MYLRRVNNLTYWKCKLNCCSVISFVQSLSLQFWFIKQSFAGDNSKYLIKKWKGAFFTAFFYSFCKTLGKSLWWSQLFTNLGDCIMDFATKIPRKFLHFKGKLLPWNIFSCGIGCKLLQICWKQIPPETFSGKILK